MRLYVEPIVFYFSFTNGDLGILPRQIFERAMKNPMNEEKLELFTSIWSLPQYVGAINELFVKNAIPEEERRDLVERFRWLEFDLRNSLTKVYPVPQMLHVCISYILNRSVNYERAWHLATAKLSDCDTYLTVDNYMDLDKKLWERDFEIYNIIDKQDVEKLSTKINNLN